ncbi:MAG: Acetoin catabolism regulatory protein [Pseudomonadota bacterium]
MERLPPTDRQLRIQQARELCLSGQARSAQSLGLSPWLMASWQRCLDQGLQAGQHVAFNPVSRQDIQRRTDAHRDIVRLAHPIMTRLVETIADRRYFAVLTDADGIVINAQGAALAHDQRARDLARIGVDLSERAVGTTAIGAALHERSAVWLHQGEHFFQENNIFSCAGAPLFGPRGNCIGMLDLTGIETPERQELKHLVSRSARQIENSLTLASSHRLVVRFNWPGEGLGHEGDGLLLLDDDGHVVGANSPAREMLGHTITLAGSQGTHASEIWALPFEHLFDMASSSESRILPTWNGLHLNTMCHPAGQRVSAESERAPLHTIKDAVIKRAVEDAKGNVTLAAKRLGIGRATVYRRLRAGRK